MPAFENQQAVQQLLSGMNSMQMQAGLMPGMQPMQHPSYFQPQPPPPPAAFSNYLMVQHRNDTAMYQGMPAMYGGVTPVARNAMAQELLPGPQLSYGWAMARQQAQANTGAWLTGAQTVAGTGARTAFGMGMSAVGAGIGTLFGGPPGALLGSIAMPMIADSFVGQGIERIASMPFQSYINQRNRAMGLQNASMQFMRSGAELSPMGAGLTFTGAMDLERQLSRMSRGTAFRRDTRDQFNQADMMKITQLAGQVGLLDNAQSVDQITRDMGKIGRALTTFMRVMDEPDVQNAMKMMGQMRNLGMNLPEMSTAASNARQFARMAGVSVQGMMQIGMQGAQTFQQMGMSGAVGLQTGMAAGGNAGILAGMLTPRQLNMLGGREGITQNLTAAAGNVANIDMLLPGLLRRGQGGLEIDQEALMGLARGKGNIQDLARQSAQRLRGLGPRGFVEEYSTRRNELRDQLMGAFGGQGAILAPMVIARSIAATGATDFRGGLRMQGLSEEQARTIELANTPEFFNRMRQQMENDFERRADAVRRQQQTAQMANERRRDRVMRESFRWTYAVGREFGRMGTDIRKILREELSEDQDIEEQRRMLGGGELLAIAPESRLGTEEQRQMLQREMRTPVGRQRMYQGEQVTRGGVTRYRGGLSELNTIRQRMEDQMSQRAQSQEETRRAIMRYGTPILGTFANIINEEFMGEQGFGFSDIGRGSIGTARTVMRGESVGTRIGNYFATRSTARTQAEVEARAAQMEEGGELASQARRAKFSGQNIAALRNLGGLNENEFAQARATASAAFEGYAHELGEGFFSNAGGFNIETARERMIEAMVQHGGVNRTTAQRYARNDAFVREVMRTGAGSRTAEARQVLEKAEASAGNIAGVRTARTETAARDMAGRSRNYAIATLGISSNRLENDQAKLLVNLLGDDSAMGMAKQKLYRARALAATGTNEGRRKADILRSEAAKLGLSDDQYAEAEASANSVADVTPMDILKRMGTHMETDLYWKNREKIDKNAAQGARQARAYEFTGGLIGLLGEGAAQVVMNNAPENQQKALQAYIESQGGKLKGSKLSQEEIDKIRRGDTKISDLEDRITGTLTNKARAVVEGGQLVGEEAAAGQNAVAAQIIDVLSAAAAKDQQMAAASYGKFDGAVDKFATATETLRDAAHAIAGTSDRQEQDKSRTQAQNVSEANSMSVGG